MELTSSMSVEKKNVAAGPIPPGAGEERDSDERTMGVGLTRLDVDSTRQRKIIAVGPHPHAGRGNGIPAKGRWGGVNVLYNRPLSTRAAAVINRRLATVEAETDRVADHNSRADGGPEGKRLRAVLLRWCSEALGARSTIGIDLYVKDFSPKAKSAFLSSMGDFDALPVFSGEGALAAAGRIATIALFPGRVRCHGHLRRS